MKAVILAGGFGKRLRPLTTEKPKPLIEVAGEPIIVHQMKWLKKYGVTEFVLCVGYLKEKIIAAIGNGSKYGVKVYYSVEDEPLGTGGGLKNAEGILRNEDVFLVLNGDILTNLDPTKLVETVKKSDHVIGAIAVIPLRSPYGVIELDERGYITKFIEKPELPGFWMNAGVYAFKPEIFDYLPEKGDIERTAFVKLAEERRLAAVTYRNVFWKSIDSIKDLEEAEKAIREGVLQ